MFFGTIYLGLSALIFFTIIHLYAYIVFSIREDDEVTEVMNRSMASGCIKIILQYEKQSQHEFEM